MANTLLLVGGSIRAAAFSARRTGLQPWGADLFGDADLPLAGRSFQRIADYREVPAGSEQGPHGPWMYTGALENRPGLVEKTARQRPLWGNSADVLRQVRDPLAVYKMLTAANVPCPRIGGDHSARWLQKPIAGAGGKGISPWTGSKVRRGHYLQEIIEGDSCAAVYVANKGRAELVGVTLQLVGQSWLHAGPFQYCGSIGPLQLEAELQRAFLRLGNALATGFSLQGLFGVDCIVRDNIPWAVEINPRYTASIEVLELATRSSVLLKHARVFDPSFPARDSRPENASGTPTIIGKAILFARVPLTFPQEGPWFNALTKKTDFWAMPAFADIPTPGQPIAARQPILTLFARDDSIAGCRIQLQQLAADLDRLLFAS
jgi:predicted ATP-grasp superfamily ATP-dependent carboligase